MGVRRAAAGGDRRAALPPQLRRRRGRARQGDQARAAPDLGARQRGALRAVRLPRRHRLRRAARALAPPLAHRGLDRGRGAVRRLAAGRRRPRRGGRARGAGVGGRARGVPRPRAGRRALRLAADRRGAAVPRDPGGRLRQGLLRRQRPLPHEHGLQARLPGVAAARARGLRGHRVDVVVAGPARAARAVRVGAAAARRPRARRRLPGGGHLCAQGRVLAAAPPLGAALAGADGARRPGRDRVAARARAAGLRRARGRRRRLLGVRPRAHLDLHRPADGARLARPRAAVGARPGHPPRRRRPHVQHHRRGRSARRCSQRYRVRYVVVGPIERADHGDAGLPKWDTLGRRVFDRGGTTVWRLR